MNFQKRFQNGGAKGSQGQCAPPHLSSPCPSNKQPPPHQIKMDPFNDSSTIPEVKNERGDDDPLSGVDGLGVSK